MADLVFESQLGYNLENGTMNVVDSGGVDPTSVICCNNAWDVKFKWTAKGDQWKLPAALNGQFHIQIQLEEMGSGEFDLAEPPKTVNMKAGTPGVAYDEDYEPVFNIAANTVPVGLYRLVASIRADYQLLPGTRIPIPVAGFCEGMMLNFYDN